MYNKNKYATDRYYVGELFIDMNQLTTHENMVNVSNRYMVDYNKKTIKKVRIAAFYKIDDEHYLCIQDGHVYMSSGISYYGMLRPLAEFLPKIDYIVKEQLSISEVNTLFKNLLGKNYKLYLPIYHDITDFYIGTIKEPITIKQSGLEKTLSSKIMPLEYWMLIRNGAYKKRALFIRDEKKLISLQSNTILDSGFIPGIGSINELIPLSETLETQCAKTLTIRQALKQYK